MDKQKYMMELPWANCKVEELQASPFDIEVDGDSKTIRFSREIKTR